MSSTAATAVPPGIPGKAPSERCGSPALLLALLGHVAMRRLREAHHAHDLSPRQFHLLGLLHERGAIAQSELGEIMGTDPSILVTMLNPLEVDGLISRRRDPEDRRRHLVTLSQTGERQLMRAAEAEEEVEASLFAGLDDQQREDLRLLLVALQQSLSGTSGGSCPLIEANEDCMTADKS